MPFTANALLGILNVILTPTTDKARFENQIIIGIQEASADLVYGAEQLEYTYTYPAERYENLFINPGEDGEPDSFKTSSVEEVCTVLSDLFTEYWGGVPVAAEGVGVSGQQFDTVSIVSANVATKAALMAALIDNKSDQDSGASVATSMTAAFAAGAALITTSHTHTDPPIPVPYLLIPAI